MDTLKKRVGEGEVKFVTSAFSTTHMYDFLYEYGIFFFLFLKMHKLMLPICRKSQ
jgi:hypothetical protein